MKKLITISLLFFSSYIAESQNTIPDLLEQISAKAEQDDNNEQTVSETAEDLSRLAEHPVNINDCDAEDLCQLPFLNDAMSATLIAYREKYGKIFSVYELLSVEGFDSLTISRISPFIYFGDEPEKHTLRPSEIIRYGRSSLFLRYKSIIQKQAGYSGDISVSKKYTGDPSGLYFRYTFSYYDRLSIGLTGEKDPGESLFGRNEPLGMDFYSGFICYNGKKFLRKLIIGNYRASFGQGLVLGSGMRTAFLAAVPGIFSNSAGISPSQSADETSLLKGIAVTARAGKFNISMFCSRNNRDGNISGEGITSFQTTGYHRTEAEISDRDALTENIAGGNITFTGNKFRAGITSFYTSLSKPVLPDDELYNKYRFSGKENLNTGVYFRFLYRNIYFSGEAAMSMNGGKALIAGFQTNPDPKVCIALTFRSYGSDYQNLRSNAIGQNSSVSNEQGILLAASWQLPQQLNISGYIDIYRFPYLKYGISNPSSGAEFRIRADYSGSRYLPMHIIISGNAGESGISSVPARKISSFSNYKLRYQNEWLITNFTVLKTRLELTFSNKERPSFSHGYLAGQNLSVAAGNKLFTVNILYVIFDTPADEKIWFYEPDILYGYSVPALSGKGIRTAFLFTYSPFRSAELWLRFSSTWYTGRNSISSGSSEIPGNSVSEIKIQLRLKF